MQQDVNEGELARLYDELARFQWWRRKLSGANGGAGLEMHKRLSASQGGRGPAEGASDLNAWLARRADLPAGARVLDVGCGFGATMFDWAGRMDGASFVGLSLSPYQVRRAQQVARALGVDGRCTFRNQSFDERVEGSFDVVVSVETLFHSADLGATFANLARNLGPGGKVLLVEDMAQESGLESDPSGKRLLELWSSARLSEPADYRDALDAAGLESREEHDLTAQVPLSSQAALDGSRRRLERIRALTPLRSWRVVVDAFLGGVALQELYARGLMSYRMWIAERRGA